MSYNEDDHEEESFFVSMTDIMVGLLFIFILIIVFFALQSKIDANTIEDQQSDLLAISATTGERTKRLLKQLEKSRIDANTIKDQGETIIQQKGFIFDQSSEIKHLTDLNRDKGSEVVKENKELKELPDYEKLVTQQGKEILNWIRSHLNNNGVEGIQVILEQGVIRLPEGILFGSGKFKFLKESKSEKAAKAIASALNDVLPCSVLTNQGRPFVPRRECKTNIYHNKNGAFVQSIYLEGHTDSVQISGGLQGDPKLTTNLKLSARRATNTFETILKVSPKIGDFHGPALGESLRRFEPILACAAYGEWRPAETNETAEGKMANRRIDLRLVMYVPKNLDALKKFNQLVRGK